MLLGLLTSHERRYPHEFDWSCFLRRLSAIPWRSPQVENFFVGGRDLPLFVIVLTLASQSIDSNATLGNADLAYKFQ